MNRNTALLLGLIILIIVGFVLLSACDRSEELTVNEAVIVNNAERVDNITECEAQLREDCPDEE